MTKGKEHGFLKLIIRSQVAALKGKDEKGGDGRTGHFGIIVVVQIRTAVEEELIVIL